MIAACLAAAFLGLGLLAASGSAGPLAAIEDRVAAAVAAAEAALDAEDARLDELAARNSRRALANGRPSLGQAAANVRLWERRIQALEADGHDLRETLNGILASLHPDVARLAQRLSAQRERAARDKAAQEQVEREKKERVRAVGRVFRDCPDCPEMVVVPPGRFDMGSPASEAGRSDNEGPVHRVTIGKPFAVGVHEVTRSEFGRFVSATGHAMGNACWTYEDEAWRNRAGRHWQAPGFPQTDRDPAVCVSWDDAQAYVAWLSRQTGRRYRLLSEAEWEFAARAGTRAARYWGEDESGSCRHANGVDAGAGSDETACNDGHARTAPVGSYAANAFGLHDVLGNVWEWTQDCWHDDYAGAPSDGRAWERGACKRRVVRGGSWINRPQFLRAAFRVWNAPGYRSANFGFRVARALAP